MARDVGAVFDLIRRTGLLDPTRTAALAGGLTRWGPSLAAGVAAGAVRLRNRPAVIDEAGTVTWGQLDHRTSLLARGLRAHRVPRGSQMGILCRNHRGFVEASVAAAKAGLVPVYLNTGSAAAQLAEVIERESIGVLVGDAELLADLANAAVPGPIFAIGPDWDAVADAGRGRFDLLLPSTIAPVIMTSGTTGTPKGARRKVGLSSSAGSVGLLERIPYRSDDTIVIPAPLFHAWGLAHLTIAVSLGATIVLTERFDPESTLDAVARHGGTVLAVVPVMLQRLLASDLDLSPLRRLRIVASSGSALPATVALEWMDRCGDHLYNLYGSTEVGQASIATPDDLREAPGTAGRPVDGSTVMILDSDGEPVPDGESGRIFVGSGASFDHYTGGGDKERVHGLLSSGDVGHLDADGRLFVTGRADDMIVSGGENVFPDVVEALLLEHPAVIDAAVVGVDDPEFGQRLKAVLVVDGVLTADGVQAHVAGRLGRHFVPRDVEFVAVLPRNTTGKLLRRQLS
ncbi:MAG: AMP-binding protein [Actinomycetota bacterium]